MFKPRPKQAEVLAYRGGKMGVSAVPGSGKTATLSYLGARLVATAGLASDQEVLIVTLVKSAVNHFSQSIARYIQEEFQLLPNFGYRVRTLHSLANDIVRERPTLVGLSENFLVIDEREADDLLTDAVSTWFNTHSDFLDDYLKPEYIGRQNIRREQLPDMIKQITGRFLRQAKDTQFSLESIRKQLASYEGTLPLARMCYEIFEQYERGLQYRGAVDFQDLIRLSLKILAQDNHVLERLRYRFPYILEDEAQDSSQLQEKILGLLAGENGHWVRVGDPNQAIYETFTTANPELLRQFLAREDVQAKTLPNSGRSSKQVIRLANTLIEWSLQHPNDAIRAKKPLSSPFIELTPPGDPQGNPEDVPNGVYLSGEAYTSDGERQAIIKSLKRWLSANPDKTVAVLLPINRSGASMVQALREAGIPYVENLKSTSGTRAIVGTLYRVLAYLENPAKSDLLADVYRVWRRDERGDEENEHQINEIVKEIRKIIHVEDFLYPRVRDWLEDKIGGEQEELYQHLSLFRETVRRWNEGADLPIDQLILTIAGDLFRLESDIATAYNVAVHLQRFADLNPSAELPEYRDELKAIASGQRSFSGSHEDDEAFDPSKHKGKVAVTTMHKAKGLEWDRVYLMSVSNYDFPSNEPYDRFMSEKWFIRDSLNLEAEALGQLATLRDGTPYAEGTETVQARVEYASERLRLLYVGITRAKQELIITWNTGQRGEQTEARALGALRGWFEKEKGQ